MDRMILHSDINACYASIELLRHPELRGRPVAVGGERELRHGIILAKDQMARAAGVRTGMTLWAARQQCPELTILPPDFELYYDYSRRVREIYAGFTDRCELFLESGVPVDFLYLHDYRHPDFVEEVFRICSTRTRGKSVFVIEGIRYTPQMFALWKRMKQDGRAGITFDLYDLGIIFFDKTKIKQDYIVNF